MKQLVHETAPGVTSARSTTSRVVSASSNIQQEGSLQTIQPVRKQFHLYHAFLAVGFLAASGAGTVIIFKNSIVPRLRSWIRKVISDDDEGDLNEGETKPRLHEETTTAAKAAAAAAADAAKASQEMVILKSEEKKKFEKFISLMDDQLQEIKLMKTAMWKLEGKNHTSGGVHQVEEQNQQVAHGRNDYDSGSATSSSLTASSEPRHPASDMETMNMIQKGELPPTVRDINDAPPNPNQPISNSNMTPRTEPANFPYHQSNTTEWQQMNVKMRENPPAWWRWAPPQLPPVAMVEAGVAIRKQTSKPVTEEDSDSDGNEEMMYEMPELIQPASFSLESYGMRDDDEDAKYLHELSTYS